MKTSTFRRFAVSFFIVLLSFVLYMFIIFASIIYLLNNGNPYTNYFFNKKMPSYLEGKGYIDEDILHQHIAESGLENKDYYYDTYRVIFKDEPDMSYFYAIKKRGKSVAQYCEKETLENNIYTIRITGKTKHSEENCISDD